MHPEARAWIAANACRALTVIEIGGRNVNGTVRDLFPGSHYTAIDRVPGSGVDVVADGATWKPPKQVDVVVCCEVLEHTPTAEQIVANARQMLKPGGLLLLTAATDGRAHHSATDGGPLRDGEFYRNVSREMLAGWLAKYARHQIEVDRDRGDIYAAAWR